MLNPRRHTPPIRTAGNRELPAALFKVSLREWQARWKSQRAAEMDAPSSLGDDRESGGRADVHSD
jgi:hypothetical protein